MTTDSDTEKWLADLGLLHRYDAAISIAAIREKTSSQSRFHTEPAIVQHYAELMQDGVDFPAIILVDEGDTFEIAHGLHRHQAARQAGKTTIDAYIVDTPSKAQREALELGDNPTHGQPMKRDERLAAALHYVIDEESRTPAEAARMVGLPVKLVQRKCEERRAAKRLLALGVPATDLDKMSRDDVRSLASLNDPVAKQVFDDAKSADHLANLRQVVRKVKKGTSEEEQLAIASQEATRLQPVRKATAGGKFTLAPGFKRVRNALLIVIDADPVMLTRVAREAGEEMAASWKADLDQAIVALGSLRKEIDK